MSIDTKVSLAHVIQLLVLVAMGAAAWVRLESGQETLRKDIETFHGQFQRSDVQAVVNTSIIERLRRIEDHLDRIEKLVK